MTEQELKEKIAEAIHNEWRKWAESLMPELRELTFNHLPYGVMVEAGRCKCKTCDRKERWYKMFVPYTELPEEIKEFDRPWADQILFLIKDAGWKSPEGRNLPSHQIKGRE